MRRIIKRSPEAKSIINKLVQLFNRKLSVRKTVSTINSVLEGTKHKEVQIQRVLTLLDSDMDKAISNESYQSIKYGLTSIEETEGLDSQNEDLREEISTKYELNFNSNMSPTDAVLKTSQDLRYPYKVVEYYVEGRVVESETLGIHQGLEKEATMVDWSWQDDAVESTLLDLKKKGNYGLIIPTGGGKTRISQRIILEWLKLSEKGKVLWVTHRNLLLSQARKSFRSLMDDMNIKGIQGDKYESRFLTKSNLDADLKTILGDKDLSLIVIDEAHHGAASTYKQIINQKKCSVISQRNSQSYR